MSSQKSRREDRLEASSQSPAPGKILKAKREEYEWAIESVAQALHLSTASIRAIEENRYDLLPGSTYVMGYWRSYARLLGINMEETIVANKRNLQAAQPKSTSINMSGGTLSRGDSRKGLVWLMLSVLILAGLTFAWKSGVLDPKQIIDLTQLKEPTESTQLVTTAPSEEESVLRKAEEKLLPKPAAANQSTELIADSTNFNQVDAQEQAAEGVFLTKQEATPSDAIARSANNAETITIAGLSDKTQTGADGVAATGGVDGAVDKNLLIMNLEKNSWLDVRDKSNKRLIYRSGKAGESINIRGEPPFYVYIGTPDGVNVTYLKQNVPFKTHPSGLFARFKLDEVLESL